MRTTAGFLMVLLFGVGPVGAAGCGIQDDPFKCLEPNFLPECHPGPGDGSGGVRVTIEDSIVFEWNGTGADSVLLFRGSAEVWAIRPTAGSSRLSSPLVYGSHPANTVSYVDSLPQLTTSPNYIVRV